MNTYEFKHFWRWTGGVLAALVFVRVLKVIVELHAQKHGGGRPSFCEHDSDDDDEGVVDDDGMVVRNQPGPFFSSVTTSLWS